MAYIVAIRKNNEYVSLDISKLSTFNRLSKFKNGYSLKEIDLFTSKYDNILELKKDLYLNGIIDKNDILKDITIKSKINGKYKKVMYSFFYRDDFGYLDVNYLRYKLLSRSRDAYFLKKFINYYSKGYNSMIVNIINNLVCEGNLGKYVEDRLIEFFYREIYYYDRDKGKSVIKYRCLHDLAMFICNYDHLENLDYVYGHDDFVKLKDSLEIDSKNRCKIKSKCKSENKKRELEGQLSLYDI